MPASQLLFPEIVAIDAANDRGPSAVSGANLTLVAQESGGGLHRERSA